MADERCGECLNPVQGAPPILATIAAHNGLYCNYPEKLKAKR